MTIQTNDLKKHRNKKKRKQLLKRFLIVSIIAVIGIAGFATRTKWLPLFDGIFDKYKTTIVNDGTLAEGNFPLKISEGSQYIMSSLENKLALVTDTHFYIYSKTGALAMTEQHAMTNPILKTSGGRALIYDLGGNSFEVIGKLKVLYSKNISDKIIYGEMSNNDFVAIVTKSDKFASGMTVYDPNGNEVFTSFLNEKILDIAFKPDNSGCVATTISASGGQLVSKMISFNFKSEKEDWKSEAIPSLALFTACTSSGETALVGDTQYSLISRDGKISFTYNYTSKLSGYSSTGDLTAVVVSNNELRKTTLNIISGKGNPVLIPVNYNFEKVSVKNNKIYIMTAKELITYSPSGNVIATVVLKKDYSDFTVIDDNIYLLGVSVIDCITYKT